MHWLTEAVLSRTTVLISIYHEENKAQRKLQCCPIKERSQDLNPGSHECWAKCRSWISPFDPHSYPLSSYCPQRPCPWSSPVPPSNVPVHLFIAELEIIFCRLRQLWMLIVKSSRSGFWYFSVVPSTLLSPLDVPCTSCPAISASDQALPAWPRSAHSEERPRETHPGRRAGQQWLGLAKASLSSLFALCFQEGAFALVFKSIHYPGEAVATRWGKCVYISSSK